MSTNSGNKLSHRLDRFSPISLDEMDNVSFLKRADTKYVFHINRLEELLLRIQKNYQILEINEARVQNYETVYFDTAKMDMYFQHHNGLRSRFKVRAREYINSELYFLEVKTKNNKQVTTKKRISIRKAEMRKVQDCDAQFLQGKIPFKKEELQASIINRFSRITFVNSKTPERMTIDFNLIFAGFQSDTKRELPNACILETKRNRGDKNRELDIILKECRIYPMGFSKYCFGVTLINPELKNNRFKPRIHQLRKEEIIN